MALCTVLNHFADVPLTIRRVAAILSQAVTKRFAPHESTGEGAHVCVCVPSVRASDAFFNKNLNTYSYSCSGRLFDGRRGRHVLSAFCITCIGGGMFVRTTECCIHTQGMNGRAPCVRVFTDARVQQVAKVLQALVGTSDMRKEVRL